MRAIAVLAPVLVLAAAATALFVWRAPSTPSRAGTDTAAGTTPSPAAAAQGDVAASPVAPAIAERTAAAGTPTASARPAGGTAPIGAGASAWPLRGLWPVKAPSTKRGGENVPGEPSVPVRLAFRALWYLGTDPAAEVTWSRAINDANHPEGVRSDLIVDMIDEGYTDNDRPGLADLALIRRRLEILERYAPHAMDEINAQAFEEAYRTLLALYLRLGGEARIPVSQPR